MGKLIAVWGSPDSGKTTFSVKLAEALYNRSRGKSAVIVVFTDIVTPTIPVIFPNFRSEDVFSVGTILTKPDFFADDVVSNMVMTKDRMNLGYLGYKDSENKHSFACLNRAVEYVQLSEELERRFMAAVKRMKLAFNLCSASDKFTDEDKDYIHFYCGVRSILFKLTKGDAPDIAQMNARVREMLEGAIQSDGIEELFETGKHISVDIFSDEYMDKINAIQFLLQVPLRQ